MPISINQQLDEVDRELAQRKQVYPRLVSGGKLRQSIADYQVARLEAVRNTLVWLRDNEDMIKQRFAHQGQRE